MDIEKERLSGNFLTPNWVEKEHVSRYHFAADYTTDKQVIDCACGSGVGTEIFARKAASVQGFDVSEEAITEAKKVCQHNNVTFSLGSATKLPVADEWADVYISLETIEHINEDTNYLAEAVRVLKKGGVFICSTPNRTITNPGKTIKHKPANIFHIREYTEQEFIDLLSKYFSKVEIKVQNPNSRFQAAILAFFGKFLPLNLAVRMHQFMKLVASFFRNDNYYKLGDKRGNKVFEYMTAVCTK